MNRLTRTLLSIVTVGLVALVGCERSDSNQGIDPQTTGAGGTNPACAAFQYADTVFYYREQTTPYLELPTTAQSGTYGTYPQGLSINAATGAINVNASESGLKYRVWFVKTGTADTCTRYVTISGVNYTSKVYQLSANDTLARPFYNAIRALAPPCSDDDDDDDDDDEEEDEDDDDDDDDDNCEFDDGRDDDDGDGLGDEPPAGQEVIPQGIAINKLDGIIDLRQTVNNGTFGTTPVNGSSKSVRIYYRLNDASNKTLNHIDVTFHWYATLSQVPASLLSQITTKTGATLRVAATSLAASRPRPPDIVLVGR
ncbi:hypothetical protein [Spirosoma montaniterrae]|uniref:Lipoprotein n=1 Tax=Spirosoma montaniterrae TaxID=1178516 RepID=A0A1P9WTH4_9BACT|nr:hypothetical protein [Spirosoma montaniterrae]AQG78633.1 hypothetical protein AWR27_04350 [Spirosoma montaniterrae]